MPAQPPRFEFALPEELWDQFEELAEKHEMKPVELMRQFFKIGLLFYRILDDPNSQLIMKDNEGETEIVKMI